MKKPKVYHGWCDPDLYVSGSAAPGSVLSHPAPGQGRVRCRASLVELDGRTSTDGLDPFGSNGRSTVTCSCTVLGHAAQGERIIPSAAGPRSLPKNLIAVRLGRTGVSEWARERKGGATTRQWVGTVGCQDESVACRHPDGASPLAFAVLGVGSSQRGKRCERAHGIFQLPATGRQHFLGCRGTMLSYDIGKNITRLVPAEGQR